MLFNPNWNKSTTKPDTFSLGGLIEWLEGQNPTEAYDYQDTGYCLLAQYFSAKGYRCVSIGTRDMAHGWFVRTNIPFPPIMNTVASRGLTFGGALKIAKAYKEHGYA